MPITIEFEKYSEICDISYYGQKLLEEYPQIVIDALDDYVEASFPHFKFDDFTPDNVYVNLLNTMDIHDKFEVDLNILDLEEKEYQELKESGKLDAYVEENLDDIFIHAIRNFTPLAYKNGIFYYLNFG